MTEQEKMLAGKIYDPSDETLLAIRTKAHKLCQTYNQTADTEEEAREQMMRDLIPDNETDASVSQAIHSAR